MKVAGTPDFQNDIRTVFTVSELTEGIGLAIEGAFPGFLHVEGEVSNLKESSSGHAYFTLKDSSSQIRGVFSGDSAEMKGSSPETVTRFWPQAD